MAWSRCRNFPLTFKWSNKFMVKVRSVHAGLILLVSEIFFYSQERSAILYCALANIASLKLSYFWQKMWTFFPFLTTQALIPFFGNVGWMQICLIELNWPFFLLRVADLHIQPIQLSYFTFRRQSAPLKGTKLQWTESVKKSGRRVFLAWALTLL